MSIDPSLIGDRLKRLDEYVATLRRLAGMPRTTLTEDRVPLGSAERHFEVAIETCLDIANHMIAGEHLRRPENYADAFAVLSEAGILPTEFLSTMQRMARFRNRLVHLYWEVDAETVYEILQTRLDDFDRFKGYVLTFLLSRGFV